MNYSMINLKFSRKMFVNSIIIEMHQYGQGIFPILNIFNSL